MCEVNHFGQVETGPWWSGTCTNAIILPALWVGATLKHRSFEVQRWEGSGSLQQSLRYGAEFANVVLVGSFGTRLSRDRR